MKLEGTYTFDAPRDLVWDSLLDPEVLARVMPGCEALEKIGDNEYEGMIKIKVGPVQGNFKGVVTLSDIMPPNTYTMTVDGKGAPGFMKGVGHVVLEEQGNSTLMTYAGEAQVGGKIASVGQRLIDSSAKALTKQSLDGLSKQIQARLEAKNSPTEIDDVLEAAAGSASTATPRPSAKATLVEVEAPSEIEFALGVARNMVEDLIPPERRPTLIAAGFGMLALFLFLNWWTNRIAHKVATEIWERR